MKLNKWMVNDATAQAYKDGRVDAIDEVLEIIRNYFGHSTSEMIRRVEDLKEQNNGRS